MAIQSVPSLMGITKAPYASFAGKSVADTLFTGSVLGFPTITAAQLGRVDVDKGTKGTTTIGGAVIGTATLG